jgi:YHS domain-containing protein
MMARDPVCGVPVVEEHAAYTSEYNGRTYYFCSEHCKREFDQDPQLYIQQQVPDS